MLFSDIVSDVSLHLKSSVNLFQNAHGPFTSGREMESRLDTVSTCAWSFLMTQVTAGHFIDSGSTQHWTESNGLSRIWMNHSFSPLSQERKSIKGYCVVMPGIKNKQNKQTNENNQKTQQYGHACGFRVFITLLIHFLSTASKTNNPTPLSIPSPAVILLIKRY